MCKKTDIILEYLETNPIIPCTNNFDDILVPKFEKINVVLLYDLNIISLMKIAKKNMDEKKQIILNVDTIEGISTDKNGLNFIKEYLKIDTIASSSPKIINYGKKLKFTIMQTLFMFDTKSLKKGIELVKQSKPDFIDIRPGISFLKIEKIIKNNIPNIPIICSGLIQHEKDLRSILGKNAKAVTTSNQKLWNLFL